MRSDLARFEGIELQRKRRRRQFLIFCPPRVFHQVNIRFRIRSLSEPAGIRDDRKLPAGFSLELFWFGCVESSKIKKGRRAMATALEINFALWIMIGCMTVKLFQLVGYLN